MQVRMHAAKSQLSKLVEAAQRREEVILAKGDTPVARIVPFAVTSKPFIYGLLADVLKGPVPAFEPMSDEEVDQLEREKDERAARSVA